MNDSLNQNPDVVTIGGRFGWALTKALIDKHPDWNFLYVMRDPQKVGQASKTGRVDAFFTDKIQQAGRPDLMEKICLSGNIRFISLTDFKAAFRGTINKLFIPAVPSSRMHSVLEEMLDSGIPKSAFGSCEVLAVSKGMETKSLLFPHEIIDNILGVNSVVALGGNLAFDVVIGEPMLMELAGYKQNARRITHFFEGSNLIIYETLNRRKLSLAGPMKNIHSLATGMTSEIFGSSSVSTVATMGLCEYERAAFIIQFRQVFQPLARVIQKIPFHFRSVPIAGGAMSDYHLFRFTRNFMAGQEFVKEIRKNHSAEQAIGNISRGNTIESFSSAAPTCEYLKKMGCVSPVIETTRLILEGELTPEDGIKAIIRQQNLIPS